MSEFLQNYGMVFSYAEYFSYMFLYALQKNVKGTYTVFDVGFNTGQFTRLASECFKSYKQANLIHPDAKLRIFAFEPNSFLAEVAPHFDGLEVHQVALSNEEGTATLHVPLFGNEPDDLAQGASNFRNEYGGVYGTSTLGSERKEDLVKTRPDLRWQRLDVVTTTLDKFCAEHGVDEIDWLKLDVEAFEKCVLQGAMGMLNRGKIAFGQFEGDTTYDAPQKLPTAMANNAETQAFLNECNLGLIDTEFKYTSLPTQASLIESEFFFVARQS